MKIVEIIPINRQKSKVFLEEAFAFPLYNRELRQFELEEGGELSEEQYRRIETEVLDKRARARCVHLLERSDRTEQQLCRALEDSGYPEPVIARTLAFLKGKRFVDDRRYAAHYLEIGKGRKSRRQMSYELRQKGVDREIIEEVLAQLPEDEETAIRREVSRKVRNLQEADRDTIRKLYASLSRKGYPYEAIRRVLGDMGRD